MKTHMKVACWGFAVCWFAALAVPAHAEEFEGEIVDLAGSATVLRTSGAQESLKEGDTVKIGETIKLGKGSEAVLALDGDMKNTVFIAEETDLKINSIYPTSLSMTQGDVLARLQSLPQGSTFEIETPIGLAAVRGSEFRTVVGKDGMEVFNLEHSNVYVFNQELNGQLSEEPVIVPQSQGTAVARRGLKPLAPQPIPAAKLNMTQLKEKRLIQGVERRVAQGKPSKIPRIAEAHRIFKEKALSGGRPELDRQDRIMRKMDGADHLKKHGPGQSGQSGQPQDPQEKPQHLGPQGPQKPQDPNGPQNSPQGEGSQAQQFDRHPGPDRQPGPNGPKGPDGPNNGPNGPGAKKGGDRPAGPKAPPRRPGPQ